MIVRILDAVCKVYLTVIRGTPAMIQLLIMYYIVFTSPDISKRFVAILTFGINSGAYVAEIVRSGIMSIDNGQFEAGRSLGFNYVQTMMYIIAPQAFKNILPALANEFITLLKETSICGYIALTDITHGANVIRSQTYEPMMPLLAAALIYLVIVSLLSTGDHPVPVNLHFYVPLICLSDLRAVRFCLRDEILLTQRVILIYTVRRLVWYSSILICFRIKPYLRI